MRGNYFYIFLIYFFIYSFFRLIRSREACSYKQSSVLQRCKYILILVGKKLWLQTLDSTRCAAQLKQSIAVFLITFSALEKNFL